MISFWVWVVAIVARMPVQFGVQSITASFPHSGLRDPTKLVGSLRLANTSHRWVTNRNLLVGCLRKPNDWWFVSASANNSLVVVIYVVGSLLSAKTWSLVANW